MIFKFHHIMTDAYGFVTFMANIMDEYDPKILPPMKKFTLWDKFLLYLSIPFNFVRITIKFLTYPADKNSIASGKPFTGEKKGAFSKEYNVDLVKVKCKELGVTFNDLFMTIMSLSIKRYFISKGDEKSNKMLVMIPINFRERPTTPENFEFKNQFAIFPMEIKLFTDFDTAVKVISRDLKPIRNSFVSIGMFYLVELLLALPFPVSTFMVSLFAAKPTLFATNVAAPAIPYRIAGSDSIKVQSFVPNQDNVAGGFAFVTHNNILCIGFSADTGRCSDAKQIIQYYEEELDLVLARSHTKK